MSCPVPNRDKIEYAQGRDLALIFGDLRQNEKHSEIKQPLTDID